MLNISSGRIEKPQKVVIYGPEGIGKTTFASQFPDPVFIDTEGSTYHMDVKRTEKPQSWQQLMDQVKQISQSPGICKTLVLDTADWAEMICTEMVCNKYQKKGIEDFGYDDYGMIPFFRLDNGKKRVSGLKRIKSLIDDYDLMNAGLSNNIQDTNEALYVVKGFQGDNLDELMLNIRTKKHIGVDDDGGLDIKTVNIPVDARKVKMEVDEKNIFRFGQGVNTEALKDTSATTSIAIKSAYANLDLKCDGLQPFLLQFMRKLLKLVLREINATNGTTYAQKDVYFDFEREIITNAQENAQIDLTKAQEQQTKVTTILNTAAQLGHELTMQLLCEAMELDYDDVKEKLPKQEEDPASAAQAALGRVQPVE